MSGGERSYHYKLRGRSIGPRSIDEMRAKVRDAQVTPSSEVSIDGGVSWHRATDFQEIFAKPAASTGGQWYYAVNGNRQGPISLTALQQYIASRAVGPDDLVFKEGTDNWVPVSSMPELSIAVPQQMAPAVAPSVATPVVIHQTTSGQPESNGMAIAGFVLALVGCLIPCLGPLGLVFSLIALNSQNPANKGLAIAGAIIGGLITLGIVAYIIFVILVAAANAGGTGVVLQGL
jgi:hypothetical protein